MKYWLTFLAIFLASYQFAIASTIEWDVVHIDHQHGYYEGYGYYNWAELYFTSNVAGNNFNFDCEVGYHRITAIPDHSIWTLAYPMNFVEMYEGDTVNEKTVRGSRVVYFHGQWLEPVGSYTYEDLTVFEGETTYLGFAIEIEVDEQERVIYGWASLIFDGTDLRVDQSAMDISGAPIVILPRQIPEPGTLSLFLVGISGLLLKRRHLDWREPLTDNEDQVLFRA